MLAVAVSFTEVIEGDAGPDPVRAGSRAACPTMASPLAQPVKAWSHSDGNRHVHDRSVVLG